MNTTFLLMAEYGTATVKLADIAERYLGMTPSTADVKANAGQLPIPTFRVGTTQKAPRMVHLCDLAEWIDLQRKIAKDEIARLK